MLTGIGGSAGFFFDLGLSVNKLDTVPYHSISSACFASVEMHVRDKTVFGPKIGVWAWGGPSPLLMGINLIYYTDLKENCLVLRPEIGVGIGAGHARLKLTYGYNARLVNTSFDRVSRNMFSATYYLKLRSLL
ncbi:MAG TPA: hypothetical protein VFR58_07755 [Flavisolibacter sp.]|nr:hypothetical protein [Flavisolibacter sp.]